MWTMWLVDWIRCCQCWIIDVSGAFPQLRSIFLQKEEPSMALSLFCNVLLSILQTVSNHLCCLPPDSHHLLPAGPGPRLCHQHRTPHRRGFAERGKTVLAGFYLLIVSHLLNLNYQSMKCHVIVYIGSAHHSFSNCESSSAASDVLSLGCIQTFSQH